MEKTVIGENDARIIGSRVETSVAANGKDPHAGSFPFRNLGVMDSRLQFKLSDPMPMIPDHHAPANESPGVGHFNVVHGCDNDDPQVAVSGSGGGGWGQNLAVAATCDYDDPRVAFPMPLNPSQEDIRSLGNGRDARDPRLPVSEPLAQSHDLGNGQTASPDECDSDGIEDAASSGQNMSENEDPSLPRRRQDSPRATEGARAGKKGSNNHHKTEEDNENGDEEEDEDEDEESEEEEEEESEEEEEDLILENRLRRRETVNQKETFLHIERQLLRRISQILKKDSSERNSEEKNLLKNHPKLTDKVKKRLSKKIKEEQRKLEIEESPEELYKKCVLLAKAIEKSRNLVVYTGAGISTAANIPDYRGPNGVWTLLDQGKQVAQCNLEQAEPTFTHMALFTLYKKGKLKHIVSQNCDGLHMRSGIPRAALSEIHGNMFIEICKHCKPMRPFVRVFDVTEKTNKNRHTTNRRCYVCGNSLYDTIVHFGERGSLKWPINWKGATRTAEKADVILCLGSSLKVLRRYSWLWCMDRPPKARPKLYIVNLQWTPKDSSAKVKLNGRCDNVMQHVMTYLGMKVPGYHASNDPLISYATPLSPYELHTSTRKDIITTNKSEGKEESSDNPLINPSIGLAEHDYASTGRPRRTKPVPKGQDSQGNLDYKTMPWPRDALYLTYEPSFEYIDEDAAIGEDAFCCDCCDPAKRKRRKDGETSSDEEEEEDVEDTDSLDSKSSKASSLKNGLKLETKNESLDGVKPEVKEEEPCSSKSSTPTALSSQPGWFGKGRRKKSRIS